MHHQKALTFNDPGRAREILATSDPKKAEKTRSTSSQLLFRSLV